MTRGHTNLGARIRSYRMARGWSQADLASKIGVSRPTVTQWESGDTKNIRNDNLVSLAKALQISLNELLQPAGGVKEDGASYGGLAPDERTMVEKYRRLTGKQKTTLQTIADALDSNADQIGHEA